MDPTIPRSVRPVGLGIRGPRAGRFIRYTDGRVLLTDEQQNRWSLDSVQILAGSWGFSAEGVRKLPRPWEYDAAGNVLVEGDTVLIDFMRGNPQTPLVRGGIVSVSPSDFFDSTVNHERAGASDNRLRARVAAIVGGVEVGAVQVRVCDDDQGTLEVEATQSIVIEVGPDLDAPITTITLTGTEATIKTTGTMTIEGSAVKLGEAATESVLKGDAFALLYNAHTHPPASPPGPTFLITPAQLSTKVSTE